VKPREQVPTQELPTVLFLGQVKMLLGGLLGLAEHTMAATAPAENMSQQQQQQQQQQRQQEEEAATQLSADCHGAGN
jgi:hemolysin activation/secretion protein